LRFSPVDLLVLPIVFMHILYIVLGVLCVILAGLGVLLPGLPATPFLLLASFAFARSSKRMHDWLINNKVFGPILSDFLDRKGIRLHIKIISLVLMWGMMFFSVFYLIENDIVKYVTVGGALVGTFAILRFKTIRDQVE
jgi:uncharacterized membrane protein YbaN (DUF454 family)